MMMPRNRTAIAGWIGAAAMVPVMCLAVVGHAQARLAAAMADDAKTFLAALTPDQKAKASLQFNDIERIGWHFIPHTAAPRKGVGIKELNESQRASAMQLLKGSLSASGFQKAQTIISLENVLRDLERGSSGGGGMSRDPELYFFSVFGTPSPAETWGWRVEGHHISLNITVVRGDVIVSTPLFLGANPREVRDGPRKGLRALAAEEDKARALVLALDAKQRQTAIVDPVAPKDILTYNHRRADPLVPAGRLDPIYGVGLTAAAMNAEQRALLNGLIDEYLSRMADEVARERGQKLRASDFDRISFAWAGGTGRGDLHYYRVQGPTFLIEYDCTQGNGNHIHSVWRDFNGDFGLDLLAEHYRATSHAN
jgi:hypothetical protein